MTGGDVAVVIGAIGGVLTVGVNAMIQWKTFKLAQLNTQLSRDNAQKIDANTKVTEDAKRAQEFATTQVIEKVQAAKDVSLENRTALSNAAERIAQVSSKIDTVAESASKSVDRLSAAKLAQGVAEGHIAGVAAEQARMGATTQEVRALTTD